MTTVKIVVKTSGDGKQVAEHSFDKSPIGIGRARGNDIVLVDTERRVSGRHSVIDKRENGWFLTDLGSTNGTSLNEQRLEANQAAALRDGDRIAVGAYQLLFFAPPEEGPGDLDRTIVHINPAEMATQLADELCRVYAEHVSDAPEARGAAVKRVLQGALAGVPKPTARVTLAQLRSRFQSAQAEPGAGGTTARRRDAEIERQEEYNQAGLKALSALSSHFLGEAGFRTPEQVETFGKLIEQTLNVTLQWLASALKGRHEFEDQFSADLTLVFSKEGNPIKTAAAPTDIGRFLLDWRGNADPGQRRASLEGAFKDLTMHQLGLLAGVQEALKAALTRLDPAQIEQQAAASGILAKLNVAKRAWDIYAQRHKEMFEENSKLFNEVIYPSIRKGYLATHADAEGAKGAQP